MTSDLSYELEGGREEDVCAKKMNGMSKNKSCRVDKKSKGMPNNQPKRHSNKSQNIRYFDISHHQVPGTSWYVPGMYVSVILLLLYSYIVYRAGYSLYSRDRAVNVKNAGTLALVWLTCCVAVVGGREHN